MTFPLAIGAVVVGVPTTFHTPLSGQRSPVFAVVPTCAVTSVLPCSRGCGSVRSSSQDQNYTDGSLTTESCDERQRTPVRRYFDLSFYRFGRLDTTLSGRFGQARDRTTVLLFTRLRSHSRSQAGGAGPTWFRQSTTADECGLHVRANLDLDGPGPCRGE